MLIPNASREETAAAAEAVRARVEALRLPHPDSSVAPVVTVSVVPGTTRGTDTLFTPSSRTVRARSRMMAEFCRAMRRLVSAVTIAADPGVRVV